MFNLLPKEIVTEILDFAYRDERHVKDPWYLMIDKTWMQTIKELKLFKLVQEFKSEFNLADVEYRTFIDGIQESEIKIARVNVGRPRMLPNFYGRSNDKKGLSIHYDDKLDPIREKLYFHVGQISKTEQLLIRFAFGVTFILEANTISPTSGFPLFAEDDPSFLLEGDDKMDLFCHRPEYQPILEFFIGVPFSHVLVNVTSNQSNQVTLEQLEEINREIDMYDD